MQSISYKTKLSDLFKLMYIKFIITTRGILYTQTFDCDGISLRELNALGGHESDSFL